MAAELAARFAPTLYFDTDEQWFPTDPRPYTSRQDGETVVSGFDALNGYHERFTGERPPNPTVFYNAVGYEDSSLAVVQFWFYSVFDQFTTNFHWHDWEVLHVFVGTGLVFAHSGREGDDAESAQGRANSNRSSTRPNGPLRRRRRATRTVRTSNFDRRDASGDGQQQHRRRQRRPLGTDWNRPRCEPNRPKRPSRSDDSSHRIQCTHDRMTAMPSVCQSFQLVL